mgnify:CR=1 FL=1
MKKNAKYNYLTGTRATDHGSRIYDVAGYRLPSVTTILGKTKNQQFLKEWKAKVGEKEAERIKNLSSVRGTAMHKYLESHIEGIGYEDLTDTGKQATRATSSAVRTCTQTSRSFNRKSRGNRTRKQSSDEHGENSSGANEARRSSGRLRI